MNRTFAIVLAATLIVWAGCGRSRSKTITAPDGAKATVTSEGDQTTVTIKGAKGETVQFTQGGANVPLPQGFPADVPLYPGAKVTTSSKSGETMMVGLESGDPARTVVAFYEDKLKTNGWTIQQTTNTADGGLVFAAKGDHSCSVVVNASGKRTTALLSVTAKGG
jgi:hypothetical protein